MRYRVQHAHSGLDLDGQHSFREFQIEAEVLPRIGEDVEIRGVLYRVIAVFHNADGSMPTVRVRG